MPVVKPLWPHERGQSKGNKRKGISIQYSHRWHLRILTSTQHKIATKSIDYFLYPAAQFMHVLEPTRELRDEIYSFALPSYTTLKFAAPEWPDCVRSFL